MPANATTDAAIEDILPVSTRMPEGEAARAPIGYINLCRTEPSVCEAPEDAETRDHRLSAESWRQLASVNGEVNAAIRPLADAALGSGPDVWSIAPAAGDCEDYALTKRAALIAQGWPAAALPVAVVRDEHGRHHAVLIARTDRGDFVLDNRQRGVRAWGELPYRWIKVQSGADPRQWVQLSGYVEEMIERKAEFLRRLAARD